MSVIKVPVYREEAGTMHDPAVELFQNTHCTDTTRVKKKFETIFIHFSTPNWVVDVNYVPNQSIPALKVTNPCDDTFAFLNISAEDYRALQDCCEPVELTAEMDVDDFAAGENVVNVQLGCDEASLVSVPNQTGASVAAILILIAAYLNLTYPELGFFFVDGNTITLTTGSDEVIACPEPVFTIEILTPP